MLFNLFCRKSSRKQNSQAPSTRRIAFETLEDRQMLSVSNAVSEHVEPNEWTGTEAPFYVCPRLIVNSSEDGPIDHTDDFNPDGTPNKITLREAIDYVGKRYNPAIASFTPLWYDRFEYASQEDQQDPNVQATYNHDLEYTGGVYKTIYFSYGNYGFTMTNPISVANKYFTIDGVCLDTTYGETVTIDGRNVTKMFSFGGSGSVALKNLTLQNSGASSRLQGRPESAVSSVGNLSLENVTFLGGKSNFDGGAIAFGGTNLTVDSCTFEQNQAANGAAIFVRQGSATIRDSTFKNNTATNYGGAICVYGATGRVDVFSNNANTIFIGNSAKLGGAVYNRGVFTTNTQNNTRPVFFESNKALSVQKEAGILLYGSGGAIYNSASESFIGDLIICKADFRTNTADKYGGAISNYGRAVIQQSNFISNEASTGGAIQSACCLSSVDNNFETNVAKYAPDACFLNSTKTDRGGNGGAIFISVNSSLKYDPQSLGYVFGLGLYFGGDNNEFMMNSAENAGGAIDCVSGGVFFHSGGLFADADTVSFTYNHAGVIGGAIVFAQDYDLSTYETSNVRFKFEENTSDFYAPDIAAATTISDYNAQALADFFCVRSDWQVKKVETFRCYVNNQTMLRFDDFAPEFPNAEVITAYCTQTGAEVELTRDNPEIPIRDLVEGMKNKCATIFYYANHDPSVQFAFYVTLPSEFSSNYEFGFYVSRVEDSCVEGSVQYSFRTHQAYGNKPVKQWIIDWGDGQVETYDRLGYTLNTAHLYENKGVYRITLTVEMLDGSVSDVYLVGKCYYYGSSAAVLDEEITDSLFNNLDWLDDAI